MGCRSVQLCLSGGRGTCNSKEPARGESRATVRIVTLALWPCVEAGLRVGLGGGVRCACVKVKHL